jgi:deazaflavin-dependent oxidoreductase (nitroreductase family)
MVMAVAGLSVLSGAAAALAVWWRRHPRFGSAWINRVVDPWLVRRGIIEKSGGEIGLIEHVGRTSGIVRVTPVHPVPTENGFRIIVPLGRESQWVRNVVAAGRSRLQVGSMVYEVDEPTLISPAHVDGVPAAARRVMQWLGFRYLELRRAAEAPGTLIAAAATNETAEVEGPEPTIREIEPEPVPA